MREKLNNGHALFMDNYYNSFPLASELLSQKTYCTGTLRLDRKYLPEEVKNAKLKKGETIAAYAEGVMVAKWKDRRVVAYLSTEFENIMAVSINRRQVQREKPLPILQYNANMKGFHVVITALCRKPGLHCWKQAVVAGCKVRTVRRIW
ncbi:uncharacterized protein LOC124373146 [Homalodisca vitripennis]|uniref:uncharacterized protein LOC124373146 n=1 Tax=Homalodisca vitripennis TaxID=197043 RepID=UPI001EEBCBEC|nr:uncharacterized protein LOC124373146 [Homalodisca vitripennis]